jgi:hypothetical protein
MTRPPALAADRLWQVVGDQRRSLADLLAT